MIIILFLNFYDSCLKIVQTKSNIKVVIPYVKCEMSKIWCNIFTWIVCILWEFEVVLSWHINYKLSMTFYKIFSRSQKLRLSSINSEQSWPRPWSARSKWHEVKGGYALAFLLFALHLLHQRDYIGPSLNTCMHAAVQDTTKNEMCLNTSTNFKAK